MPKSSSALDRVYAAPPAEFVRTRNAIAREVAESGDARRAAEIKRLRRPTVAVWALNQVARRDAATMTAFVDAVQSLRKAQRGGAGVPAAMKVERDARQRVIDRAEAVIAEASLRATPDVARRVSNTLLAAATDGQDRERLLAGTLDEELTPAGFELFEGARPAPPRRRGAPKEDVKALEAARKAAEQAQELERVARARRDEADAAAKKKAALARELRALTTDVRRQSDAAKAAERAASTARRRLELIRGRRNG